MTAGLIVDGVVVIAALAAFITGWRQGATTSVLSTLGVVSGLVVSAGLIPVALRLTDSVGLRLLLAAAILILLVAVGNVAGAVVGGQLRRSFKMRSSLRIDSCIGAFFQAVTLLIVAWLVSLPLAAGLGGKVATGVHNSKVLSGVDRATPQSWNQLPNKIAAMLNDSGLPPLSPFEPVDSPEVEAPRIEVENTELVEKLRPSVIHVLGDADSCRRRLLGSGFVVSPDHVMTNAHVVAGTETVRLDTVLGLRDAEVVYYNPEVDIAVLYAPDLGLEPLQWAEDPAMTGQDAIVMGFPASGPFEAAPARIRSKLTIAGPDIYATGRVEREAYTVRGTIREGNSGGPMTDAEGRVLGVVFGASLDESDTGYALTAAEVYARVGDVSELTAPVGTGECVAH